MVHPPLISFRCSAQSGDIRDVREISFDFPDVSFCSTGAILQRKNVLTEMGMNKQIHKKNVWEEK